MLGGTLTALQAEAVSPPHSPTGLRHAGVQGAAQLVDDRQQASLLGTVL